MIVYVVVVTSPEVMTPQHSQETQTIADEPLTSLRSNVNVIEIEGSLPEQSVFVDGYMMKKNLAHKVLIFTNNE